MNDRPMLAPQHPLLTACAAALSTAIAIGLLGSVVNLLESRGAPMAQLAAAERACTGRVYVSERRACMQEWLDASRGESVVIRSKP